MVRTHQSCAARRGTCVCVERRPVHHSITRSAVPGGVASATVPEAGHMPHEDLIRPKGMPVGASGRRVGDPLPGGRLYHFAQHDQSLGPRLDEQFADRLHTAA